MNKNWNDRADKDLFFTILSVKNIGVISGAEWTTIGNHMRSLGYGFTNEGCRQHFQGLRRAQNKAEVDGTQSESARRADPTLNPITRRPGPGRGRPRKSQAQNASQSGTDAADASPTASPVGVPTTGPASVPAVLPGGMVSSSMAGHSTGMASPGISLQQQQQQQQQQLQQQHQLQQLQSQQLQPQQLQPQQLQPQHQHQFQQQQHQFQQQLQQQHQAQLQPQIQTPLKTEMPDADGISVSAQTPNDLTSNHLIGSEPGSATSQDQLQLDAVQSGDEDAEADDHPAKRQRLDPHDPHDSHDPHDLGPDSTLDDEAVLALAAHNGADGTDPYPAE
ncbi:hypothetical protein A9Z42_0081190 [Trichoderma parareesei]|uniref:Myb-like domain-containing protein n=1 Tax=Trichoderma parareesei TaxID=858221 RepID=A0A2H3A5H7_TRIPA|nr:hypothetical protein A9Z42_0081190 [Trichoderma parareesei]